MRVIVRVSQHAQISQQVLDFRREKNDVPPDILYGMRFCIRNFQIPATDGCRDKEWRNLCTAFIDEVMGDQLASNALGFMFPLFALKTFSSVP